MRQRDWLGGLGVLLLVACPGWGAAADDKQEANPATLTVVVMDPLAEPLSCPCVQGYAQRKYQKLGEFVEALLERPVRIAYSDSLVAALKEKTSGRADLVIGKHSVVEHDARQAGLALRHVAALTGKDGATTQTGLIVVRSQDPAQSVSQLKGYRLIFGPAESDEKYSAAFDLLREHGVDVPEKPETRVVCDEGATTILELPEKEHGAAVISSYAKPLLEGCGTVKKGDLRVVGQTKPVPFVGAFVRKGLDADLARKLTAALLVVGRDVEMCLALETKQGFIEPPAAPEAKKK